jgi:transposase-like protein
MNQISSDIKQQVLARVQEGKSTIVEIARQHGLKVNTVYGWISRGLSSGRPLLETNKLRRENVSLKQIIGNLLLELERGKKNSRG